MTQAEKSSICIIIGTAHGQNVAGKCSPSGSLKEYQWSREICGKLVKQLQADGYRAIIDTEDINEIGLGNRVQICRNYSNYFGKSNVLYFSIHVNAAGADGQWKSATGWESHIAKNASEKSKLIANILSEEIEKRGIKVRRPLKTQNYWCSNFYVLVNTPCPAVLCESGFMDNKKDCEWLLSKEGKETLLDAYKTAIERYVDQIIVK